MHLKIHINKSIDGFTASVPTVKGCEVWSANEDEALDKVISLLFYYLNYNPEKKYKLDTILKTAEKHLLTIVLD